MVSLKRAAENPIVKPNSEHAWEHDGAFNGCVAFADGTYHMVYRALSSTTLQNGVQMQVSSIGYAKSTDGINFSDHRQLIAPTEDWETYGCEDPRITFFEGKFYIFYTALSTYPFSAYGIKIAVAVTTDFQTFEKHPVTTFNSKAMGLFPERINGKIAALLTINTDLPPAKICLALFDRIEDIWSPFYWTEWYDNANNHIMHLMRDVRDQVELGAPPVKTDKGWITIYSYIGNYMSNKKNFGIEAILLDLGDASKIIGRTSSTLISPQEEYELKGIVPDVIFPSGALIKDNELFVYYGAADTCVGLATCSVSDILEELKPKVAPPPIIQKSEYRKFTRFDGNPIMKPTPELEWQELAVYNPAAIYEGGKVHILYRAQSKDGTSVLGYASSTDGLHLDETLNYPVYVPRENFEKKTSSTGNSGCEDPRITKINDRFYLTYTAFDGKNPPRIALSSIKVEDFLNKNWIWEKPKLISPPGVDDKDACIIKKKSGEGYIAFHRLGNVIWLDFLRDLEFPEKKFLTGGIIAQARTDRWDNVKIGIAGPPIESEHGWILLYHGVSNPGSYYKIGAMLLDYSDPRKILARTDEPVLEPEADYELKGQVPNVVFGNGSVVINGVIYFYYGGGDSVLGVATMPLNTLEEILLGK